MTHRLLCALAGLCLVTGVTGAQTLTGVFTRFGDSFSEWSFATNEEDDAGQLRRRWQTQDDWTEWDYRLGEHTGQIRLKWSGNPNEWEVRGDNEIVTARTIWNGDFRQWRISDGRRTITLRTRYSNIAEEWETPDDQSGYFSMYTTFQSDPRDWTIVDELSEDFSLPMKMALIYIVLHHSTPKS